MKRALITGACGFVGSKLCNYLRTKSIEVLGGTLIDKNYDFTSCKLDITNREETFSVIKDFKPDIVYHLAAISFVPEAEKNYQNALLVNVGGTENVLLALKKLDHPAKFVFASTGEVYGKISMEQLPISESIRLYPENRYSATKVIAEGLIEKYTYASNINAVTLRFFNHTGPGQSDNFVCSSFARQLARIANSKTPPMLKVGNLDARRDFMDVDDVLEAYYLAASKGEGVINICSGKSVAISEILSMLIDISGIKPEIEIDPQRMRPSDTPDIFGSNLKAKKVLCWEPKTPLMDTLQKLYDYWDNFEKK